MPVGVYNIYNFCAYTWVPVHSSNTSPSTGHTPNLKTFQSQVFSILHLNFTVNAEVEAQTDTIYKVQSQVGGLPASSG